MKIITLEEHFQLAEIKKAVAKMLPSFAHGFHLPSYDAPDSQLEDLGTDRLHHMDAICQCQLCDLRLGVAYGDRRPCAAHDPGRRL